MKRPGRYLELEPKIPPIETRTAMSIQMVPLSAIRPNPYRHTQSYKLSESKLESLIQSYRNSGFWDGSIQARPDPEDPLFRYQIAFGHHRVEAAKRAGLQFIGLVVADRSNADMLRMMADENRDEFRADALVAVETIAAVVDAYGRGEIELEPVSADTNKAHIYALPGGKAYTLSTIARFLGWVKPSDGQATNACRAAFDAYRQKEVSAEALASIPSGQRSERAVTTVTAAVTAARAHAKKRGFTPAKVRQAERAAAKAAAKEVTEKTATRVREDAVTIGRAAVARIAPRHRGTPPVEIYIDKIMRAAQTIDPYRKMMVKCQRLVPFVDDLTDPLRQKLIVSLEAMLERSQHGITRVIAALRRGQSAQIRHLLEEPTDEQTHTA